MNTIKEVAFLELETLEDPELRQVVDFISFLKFRTLTEPFTHLDENQITKLYSESAEEDTALAESDFSDYAKRLKMEDEA